MPRFKLLWTALACGASLLVWSNGAQAQRSGHAVRSGNGRSAASADGGYDRELRSYTLTMDNLKKFKQAAISLAAYAKAHPEAEKQWGNLSDGNGGLEDQIRRIKSIPPANAAITGAGLTPRDYLLTSLAYFQAAMTAAMEDSYAKTKQAGPALPNNVNPANVAFVRQHKADIEKLRLNDVMAGDGSGGQ